MIGGGSTFQYSVRESSRARGVSLRVTIQRGLEVVVPRGYGQRKIPKIVERHTAWIRAALERAEEQRRQLVPAPPWQLPSRIALPAIGREWRVEAEPDETRSIRVREIDAGRLRVRGNVADERSCRAALQRWLGRKAREHLVPLLHQVSRDTGRPFARVGVRHQRTRWASCSRRHSISLNAKLLFLEPELVRCVLVHELCHTREMNHTPRFWSLVEAHCPEFRQHRAGLRGAWKALPAWA